VIIKVLDALKEENTELTPVNIEKRFVTYCKNAQIDVEKRLCYYLGGSEDSATRILSSMSKPLSYSKPVDKVCDDLNRADDQICKLRYEVEIDIQNVNLKSLRVRELRKILSSWNERCDGCIEKEEFIQRIEELKPKYVKEEL